MFARDGASFDAAPPESELPSVRSLKHGWSHTGSLPPHEKVSAKPPTPKPKPLMLRWRCSRPETPPKDWHERARVITEKTRPQSSRREVGAQ